MATATYDKIATTTLGSAASSITFSSIAASWTDLRLVFCPIGSVSGNSIRMRLNSDTGTNYSDTVLYGNGTSANSYNDVSVTFLTLSIGGTRATISNLYTLDFMSYAGSTYKTSLMNINEDQNAAGSYGGVGVQLWRSTSAITTILLYLSGTSQTFGTGTTATLYGIKAA